MSSAREKELLNHAEILNIKKSLNEISERDISEALQSMLDVRVIEVEREEELKKAAAQLRDYVASRDVPSSLHNEERPYLYKLILDNHEDSQLVLDAYENYVSGIRNSENYAKLSFEEQTHFDNTYQARESIVDGQKVIVLTFESKADADKFIQKLKEKGIQFTVVPYFENNNISSPQEGPDQYRSPTTRRF